MLRATAAIAAEVRVCEFNAWVYAGKGIRAYNVEAINGALK
jgi:hypothetical protein